MSQAKLVLKLGRSRPLARSDVQTLPLKALLLADGWGDGVLISPIALFEGAAGLG
ncbi:MAG: hypothetical protein WAK69_02245 [Rhodoplanes sp.]